MTEKEYFKKLDELTKSRTSLITGHFGVNFLQGYIDADERIWYKQNVGPVDEKIVKLANEIATFLKIRVKFKKVADVFKDKTLSAWYNKHKMEENKEPIC